MNSFPPSFNSENMKIIPDPNDNLKQILCKIRADIVKVVETKRQLHNEEAYFYISYNNEVYDVESMGKLNDISLKDSKRYHEYCYDSYGYDTPFEKKHKLILKIIGNELNQLFGDKFGVLHETFCGTDDSCRILFFDPFSGCECSGSYRIQFTS